MNTIEQIQTIRGYTPYQLEQAKLIDAEIRHAIEFKPESELGKYGQIGYMADVGSPHQWWEKHCISYRQASEFFVRDRDLHTVCLLAMALVKDQDG